jgi:hypothetical protein
MKSVRLGIVALVFVAALAGAQTQTSSVKYAPVDRQIAAAVSPAPKDLRSGATVLGYVDNGRFVTLRKGNNDMICLADDPTGKMFHVSCYHRSLEPFMARGRQLKAMKKSREVIDSIRAADIKAGRYTMPRSAALYQYFAPRDSVDAATGAINGAQYLYVVYIPNATEKSTGLSSNPIAGGPWIMYPGKPWAHIMIQPEMTARITP